MRDRRYLRRGAVLAVLAAGCLLLQAQLAVAAPSAPSAASASTQDTPALELKIGVPQGDLERLRAKGRSAGAARQPSTPQPRARSAADSRTRGDELSLLQGEVLSRARATASPATVTNPSSTPGVTSVPPIGERPDGDQAEECFAADRVHTPMGRVHNRFTYCQRVPVRADYWSIDNTGVPIEHEGTTEATLEVFAQGDNTDRRVRVFARIQKDSVDYDWGPLDNIVVAPNVSLSIIGQCRQDFDVCAANRGAATMDWVVWDNNDDWFYWDVHNREEPGEGRDKISYNQWFVELFSDDPEYRALERGRTNPRMMRCDSATYFRQGQASYPQACVFTEAIPRLTYELGGEHHSVAFHIFTAQVHPNDTYPLLAPFGVPRPRDKRIPGQYVAGDPDAPGLHRITPELDPAETHANFIHKEGACYKRGPLRDEYFDTGLPERPIPDVEDCDEYPFASTLEGAGHPFWDFSVKAIPFSENRSAGAALGNYYVDDRILAWDPELDEPDETNDRFYIHID